MHGLHFYSGSLIFAGMGSTKGRGLTLRIRTVHLMAMPGMSAIQTFPHRVEALCVPDPISHISL